MNRDKFRYHLLIAALLPTLIFTVLLSAIWGSWFQRELVTSREGRIQAVARQLASAAEFHLFTRDQEALANLLATVTSAEPDVTGVAIFDRQGSLLARAGAPIQIAKFGLGAALARSDREGQSRLTLPIHTASLAIEDGQNGSGSMLGGTTGGQLVGYVVLEVSDLALLEKRNQVIGLAVMFAVLAMVAGGLLAMFLAKGLGDSIARISAAVRMIGQGDLTARIQVDPGCVLAHVEAGINQMAERIALSQDDLQRRIDAATAELQAQKRNAEQEARVDPLTGLGNRRAFVEWGEAEVLRANRYGSALALVMLDLDHFKLINDEHGHDVGDQVLIALARKLRNLMREVDFVARLGGEEFAILMPGTGVDEAAGAAERIRREIEEIRVNVPGAVITCTASFGVTGFVLGDAMVQDLLVRADRLLYQAKQAGRNRVVA